MIQHSSILMADQDFDVTAPEAEEVEGLELEEDELDSEAEDFSDHLRVVEELDPEEDKLDPGVELVLEHVEEYLDFTQTLSLAREIVASLSEKLLESDKPVNANDAMILGAKLALLSSATEMLIDVDAVEFEEGEQDVDSDEAEQA
jgi:hypothetical protein